MTTSDWMRLAPIGIPAVGSVLVIFADALTGKRTLSVLLGVLSLAAAFASLFQGAVVSAAEPIAAGRFAAELFGLDFSAAFLTGAAILFALGALALSRGYLAPEEDEFPSEMVALLLLIPAGVGMVAGARHFLMLFLGIELLSIPLYILVAMRRRREAAVEGALKYFLLGAFAAGFLLYGMSLLFAEGHTLRLDQLRGIGGQSTVGLVGVALVLVGLLFKISAAPFHFWTPDAYEGAATPVTALMASATKVAAVAALLRVLPLLPASSAPVLAALAVLTMAAGNLGALLQDRVKRMLAYSSVSHAGTLVLGFAAERAASSGPAAADLSQAVWSASSFYLAVYGASAIGAFGVIAMLERRTAGDSGERFQLLSDFRGLVRRRPLLAWLLVFFLLSMAGIPPTGGFWAKYLVFAATVRADLIGWAIAGVLLSVVGAAYYLRLVGALILAPVEDERRFDDAGTAPFASLATALAAAAVVVVLGFAPSRLLDVFAL